MKKTKHDVSNGVAIHDVCLKSIFFERYKDVGLTYRLRSKLG